MPASSRDFTDDAFFRLSDPVSHPPFRGQFFRVSRGWFPNLRGHFFAPESWDGADLFMEREDERASTTLVRHATASYGIGTAYRLPLDFEARLADAYARAGVPRPASV